MDPPPAGITPEIFAEWRSPRRGRANPERLDNPLWAWLIATRTSAYAANEHFQGPSSYEAGPLWCFSRYGQSITLLPDGRQVLISGEHEDSYDPDFYIYNDLVVVSEKNEPEIYGYPPTIFPPTDFHSATPTDGQIILVGNLGYPKDRRVGQTQVLAVECRGWSVSRIESRGSSPGWIYHHQAQLQADGSGILVRGGKLFRGDDQSLVENIDDWLLHLDGHPWRVKRSPDPARCTL